MGDVGDVISLEQSGKFAEVRDALMPDDIRQTTRLTAAQVSHISYLLSMCDKFGLPRIRNMCEEFLCLCVSLDGGSREEFTGVFRYLERRMDLDRDGDAAEIDTIMEAK